MDIRLDVGDARIVPVKVDVGRDAIVPIRLDMSGGGKAGGTSDYSKLRNKPSIEGVELVGDRAMTEFVSFGPELVYASRVLDVDVMTAQQVANLLTDD